MRSTLLRDDTERTWALIFDKGDDVMAELEGFARAEGLRGAHLTAIGAFERVTLGYFDRHRREYHRIPLDEQVEVLSMVGDVARKGSEPVVHVHLVVGRRDGTTRGGHLLDAAVWPTLEVVLTEEPGSLERVHDDETGLALINVAAETAGATA